MKYVRRLKLLRSHNFKIAIIAKFFKCFMLGPADIGPRGIPIRSIQRRLASAATKKICFRIPLSVLNFFMRITGGHAARRILKVPKGLDVRPTPDLVKQAIFNSLGARVVGARVLELFAGTGALSLECLSRGAASVVCVEKSARHADVLRQNVQSAGFAPELLQARTQDAFIAIAQLAATNSQFDLILADPPYGEKNVNRRSTSFAQQLLDDANLPRLLAPGGLFVLGHTKRDTLTFPEIWREKKSLKHGDTMMRFLELNVSAGSQLQSSTKTTNEHG
jgi:16S rRNA (guanine966-N2)-methyltransferase